MARKKTAKPESETQDSWCTPLPVKQALEEFNGRVDLDPCSNPNSIIGAVREWYGPPQTCGLLTPWLSKFVFFNPPYSAGNKFIWTAKAAQEYQARRAKNIIGLLPADTDTQWFHRNVLATASALCLWEGRLTFIGDVAHPAMFPVVLPYWGTKIATFCRVFGKHGWATDNLPGPTNVAVARAA